MAAYDFILNEIKNIVSYPNAENHKHAGYKHACHHADEMAVHLYGEKPEKLLNRVRPREDPSIKEYRLESYEPTTVSTAEKALSVMNKIFNPKLYAIKPSESEDGKILYNYAIENYPVFNSIINYLSEYGLKKTMADPNAIFLVEPYQLPIRYDQEGNATIDTTIRIKPFITCIPSCNIYLITPEYGLFFLMKEKDESTGNETYYFKFVDKIAIYELKVYTTNRKDWFVEEISVYNHGSNELPFWYLGGIYDQKHVGLFKSFMYAAVPFWNKAICAESDLDGAFISHIHPQKWEVAEECEFVEHTEWGHYACSDGYIFNEHAGKKYKCPGCGGTGHKSVKSPYETYQVSKDKLTDPSGVTLSQPPFGYVEPPIEATRMLDERVDKLLEKGLNALSMDILNKIGENQSGVSKAYDRTELFDFLGKIRDLFYDKHIKNIFYFFAKFMFINKSDDEIKAIEPTIIKPNDFDIFTTQELTDQLKVSKDSNLNPGYLQVKQVEIQNKEFQSNPEMLQFLNLTVSLDPLSEVSRTDIDLMLISKTVTQQTVIIHDNIRAFVRRALLENEDFSDKDYDEQIEILTSYAEEVIKETKVQIDETAIEPEEEQQEEEEEVDVTE